MAKNLEIKKAPVVSVDLEKVRDDRCIPIARAVMNDMVDQLLPEDANVKIDYDSLIKSILQKNLDADLNITIETPYVFQLILSALAGLNKTVQTCDMLLIDDARYAAIGRKILAAVAVADVRLVNATSEEVDEDFAPVKAKIDAIFTKEKLSMLEVKYIMDNIFSGFETVSNGFARALEKSSERAEAKLFGIESMSDLTMKRLQEVLTTTSKA